MTSRKPGDYSLFWVVEKEGIKVSPSVTDRLLVATLLSAAFGALLFVASAFMSHESNTYAPAMAMASLCAAAFVIFFVAYLVGSNSKR